MQTLLDHYLVARVHVVEARRHAAVPPIDGPLACQVRLCLIHTVGVIDDDIVPPLAGTGAQRHHHTVPRSRVFKTALLVLIVAKPIAVSPAALIPVRFD